MHENELKKNPQIPFNTAKIDSFTLLIPYENVDVVSDTFDQCYIKSYKNGVIPIELIDGEIHDKEFYEGYEKTENKAFGTFLKYKTVERLFNSSHKLKFVQIMLTSKQLRSEYFNGINKENIKTIYDYLVKDQVISLSFENLLNSYVTDIDICKDYQVKGIDGFKDLKESLLATSLIEKRSLINPKNSNSKDLFGLMYNDRVKATNSKPFCKLYYKTLELEKDRSKNNNKQNFKDINLGAFSHFIDAGIARVEVTIKASKHKQYLGIEYVKTLNDLLSINEKDLSKIFVSVLGQYYNKKQPIDRSIKNRDEMAPKDLMLNNAIELILETNSSITSPMLVRSMQKGCFDKDKKSKIKKYTLEIVESLGSKKILEENDLKASNSIQILKDLKIFE